MKRFAHGRNVDFVAVAGVLGEIDPAGICQIAEAAGVGNGLSVAVARAQMIESGFFHRAGHVHDDILARRKTGVAMVATAGTLGNEWRKRSRRRDRLEDRRAVWVP